MTRWWMVGRLEREKYPENFRCAIVCPFCKDVQECPSVHNFLKHYADVHLGPEGLISVKMLQFVTWEFRDEHIKRTTRRDRLFYLSPFTYSNRGTGGLEEDWIS